MSQPLVVDSIIENPNATVIGVVSNGTTTFFAPADCVLRSGFVAAQPALAAKYNLDFSLSNATGA